ncbi:MAG: LytTR family transcriptional regulator DNA-binding domain-containing protein, partial [Lachnospiraceae bacterium]|nr:LytTR family transcriptional regulator DNA-binding domain-containing protein [Lachnospiraceae bacterium]
HRSSLVGLHHVKQITKTDVILDSGALIPLSRRMYDEVNRQFISYYKGELS